MRKKHLENLLLYALNSRDPVDVLEQSIDSLLSPALFNRIISALSPHSLDRFFEVLSRSKYDLSAFTPQIHSLLHRLPLSLPAYRRLSSLRLGLLPGPAPSIAVLNYCYFKAHNTDYSVDVCADEATGTQADSPGDAVHGSAHSFRFTEWTGEEYPEYRRVLKILCLLHRDNPVLSDYIKRHVRDDLLISLIDDNGRVNGSVYAVEELLLLDHRQAYNLSHEKSLLMGLCISNASGILCQACGRLVHDYSGRPAGQDVGGIGGRGDHSILLQRMEDAIFEENADMLVCYVRHVPSLRSATALKTLLRLFCAVPSASGDDRPFRPNAATWQDRLNLLRERQAVSTTAHVRGPLLDRLNLYEADRADAPCPVEMIASAVGLFDTAVREHESVLIGFLKSPVRQDRLLCLLPHILRTKRLFIAAFASMYPVRDEYPRLLLRKIVSDHRAGFLAVIGSLVDYYYSSGLRSASGWAALRDYPLLLAASADIADIFSMSAGSFLDRYFFSVYSSVYVACRQPADDGAPHRCFSDRFIADNSKYLLIRKILSGKHCGSISDVDVFIGLLFCGYAHLGRDTRPTVGDFITENLSQLLFKLKQVYSRGIYGEYIVDHSCASTGHPTGRPCACGIPPHISHLCTAQAVGGPGGEPPAAPAQSFSPAYRVLMYILSNVPLGVYFDCAWLTIEYFLNTERCGCSFVFLEWLCARHPSPLVCPYMRVPFARPEQLPRTAGSRLYTVLSRHFSSVLAGGNGAVAGAVPGGPVCDADFMELFLRAYGSSRQFRNNILAVYGKCPADTMALMGHLNTGHCKSQVLVFPADLSMAILEMFLIKIDFDQQDLYFFVIQELLKHITGRLSQQAENTVAQFRDSKLEYRCDPSDLSCLICHSDTVSLDLSSYRRFLVTLFIICLNRLPSLEYFRYLVLLHNNELLEYATLCLIKLCCDSCDGFDLIFLIRSVDQQNISRQILGFLLRVNPFTGSSLIPTQRCLEYALALNDYHSIIYLIDDRSIDPSHYKLLQLAYYMAGDVVRVRGINSIIGRVSPASLFFDFCLEQNYEAAEKCLGSEDGAATGLSLPQVLKALLDNNKKNRLRTKKLSEAVSSFHRLNLRELRSSPFYLHVLKDFQLLSAAASQELARVIDIVSTRRAISADPEAILLIHREMAGILGIDGFTRSIELEYLKHLREKKDYIGASGSIATLMAMECWEAIYEHALIKKDQQKLVDSKDLLREAIARYEPGSRLYYQAVLQLCEISKSSQCYKEFIQRIEEHIAGRRPPGPDDVSVLISDNSLSIPADDSIYTHSNSYSIIQKIYFRAAKHFERVDVVSSLRFYFRAFGANYEVIPRFFHLLSELPRPDIKRADEIVSSVLASHLSDLIPYYSQLSNKICVPNESAVYFERVIKSLLERYPQDTFWLTLHLINSKKENISAKITAIMESLSFANRVLFKSVQRIAEHFIRISQDKGREISIAGVGIRALLPSAVSIPGHSVLLHGIRDDVYVFTSLQSPKKIVLVGDDGRDYPMIVKYRDDLRKDSRVMDLSVLLNRLLPDNYYIRNYTVIPFTHDAGIIQYVPGLCSLKEICLRYHPNINDVAIRYRKSKRIGAANMALVTSAIQPVYNRYLKSLFSDPSIYYLRRENYIRTYAIMNIVGWFIGLGDRHAENTHFDMSSGDTVQVDLNCIFEKGRSLEIPERVPFRLTQNIVDGFGSLGTEGTYAHTMKLVLRLMKQNKDAIIANLLSFVFDPLFEWARKKNEPKRIIDGLVEKLGFEDEDETVNRLIEEATSTENLGAMYIGWMAFL